ncbi:MAG TPA: GNAT family N-acetyltransferase, partial [Planctomycetes bacterium]|nr:GNAT family N-acetyltransferase [Planctomycetota bacterium]
MNTAPKLRPAVASDQQGILDLVNQVYGEYGDRLCLERADGDLLDLQASYWEPGGEFVVLERDGVILGTHA